MGSYQVKCDNCTQECDAVSGTDMLNKFSLIIIVVASSP